jgi:signal transduction histidine kinase
VQSEAQQAMDFAKRIQLGLPAERFIEQLELVQKLRGSDSERAPDDEWAEGSVEHDPRLAMMVCYHWGFRLQERFLAGDFTAAHAAARRIDPIRWAMRSSIEEAEFEFYAALVCAAITCATDEEREARRVELSRRLARLTVWAGACPENFAARRTLVAAELARVEARELEAQRLYEEALVHARAHGFLQIEALTNELAGSFYLARGLTTSAHAYLREARDCFERWGAAVKVRQIDLTYPQLIAPLPTASRSARLDTPASQMDVDAVDKASQTLSSEMILPSLIEKLMRLALEHAGAQRGMLILLDGEHLYVEAEATTLEGGIAVDIKRTAVEQARLPQSALQYVLRTHQRLVLNDASTEAFAASDEYVRRFQPRSVLCLPIFRQGEAIGALYLENNLTTRAFTSGRVAVLDFLASQAAIWLDNARLYSDLRRGEAWLREAQHLSSTGSFYWVVDSDTVEFSEQMYRLYELPLGAPVTIDMIATRFHPDDEHLRLEMIEVARCSGGDLDYVFRARMPDQSVKYLHIVAHATRNKDGKLEYIGAVQDVTQSRLSEEALGKVRSELSHVARVTSLGVLTASIAHEVNQPITGIVTNASTCLRMLNAEPPNLIGARETAQRMIRDGRRAAEVITRLRALFSRKREVTESVDLNEATTEVITLAASELRKSGVIVRLLLEEHLPRISGDRVQLQQVILNLLLNAADALRGVANRPRHVEISTALHGGSVRLTVRDTGVGIDPVAATRLFEAFYSTKAGGMGIGLSVSRSIVESHHGQIWAAPNDGPGATFAFSLPIVSSEESS